MAWVIESPEHTRPRVAVGAIEQYKAVQAVAGVKNGVAQATSNLGLIEGVAISAAASGEAVPVAIEGSEVKLTAGASLGAGAEVMVGSVNGAVIPFAQASGVRRQSLGVALGSAAAGERFTIILRPREVVGI